jgi:hypothetical protein
MVKGIIRLSSNEVLQCNLLKTSKVQIVTFFKIKKFSKSIIAKGMLNVQNPTPNYQDFFSVIRTSFFITS